MKEQIENLIEAYIYHMEYLKNSPSYADSSKVQTVSVLREVINDLKEILKTNKSIKKI